MKLSIVVPAYNEEPAIDGVIGQCLEARRYILERTSLKDVEIIVVNDGSKDQTGPIAERYRKTGQIGLISYPENRGYGAAIKQGFQAAIGEYVAFLDGDGTCDPKYFANLFNAMESSRADVSVGSRMGPQSEMPQIRRLGNLFYVWLLRFSASSKVTDAASGMRILKKSSLKRLYPLPNGMNFTPAISAKAILDPQLKIVEFPIPYKERQGKSKLNLIRDGWRFLRTILEISFFYRPLKLFSLFSFFLFAISFGYGIPLLTYYFSHRAIRPTDIYRIISIVVMGTIGINFLLLGISADRIESIFSERESFPYRAKNRLIKNLLAPSKMLFLGMALMGLAVWLNRETITEYMRFRTIHEDWSRVLTGAFFVLLGAEITGYAFKLKLLEMYKEVLDFKKAHVPVDSEVFSKSE